MNAKRFQSPSDAVNCPNCGATVHASSVACPACGAPLPGRQASEEARQARLQNFIEESNQALISAGAKAAESAFGLGCWLGSLVSVVLVATLFVLGTRSWIVLALVLSGAALVTTAISVALSTKARAASLAGKYHRDISPEIDAYVKANRHTRQDFDSAVNQSLPEDALLRHYLSLPGMRGSSAEE